MKLSRLWRKKKPSPYGLFPWNGTWAEASANTTGYESEVIAKIIVGEHQTFLKELDPSSFAVDSRTQPFLQDLLASLAVIFWSHRPATFRVVEFGGASGKFYHLLRRIFPQIQFDWLVIETEAMCAAFKPYEENHLHWSNQLPDPPTDSSEKPFDLAIASACLMYLEKPHDVLARLSRLSRFLFINRTAAHPIPEDRIVLQRVPPVVHETSHAYWLFSESKMIRLCSTLGKMRLSWDTPYDTKRIEDTPVLFKGYLIENY